jgi:hypothetical protein
MKIHLAEIFNIAHTTIKYTAEPHPSGGQMPKRACSFLAHQEKFMREAGTLHPHPFHPFRVVLISFT